MGVVPVRAADAEGIKAAVEALAAGLLVLHPTETLVSLTGDPYRVEAALSARRIKGYDEARPFLCLVSDVAAARDLAASWPLVAERLADAFWPGPLTLVVRAGVDAPSAVAMDGTLAVRPAGDPVTRALLAAWGRPLFSTSANRRGEPAPTRVEAAALALARFPEADAIALALAGEPSAAADGQEARPSTIVDVTGPPRLARPGALSLDALREVLPDLA